MGKLFKSVVLSTLLLASPAVLVFAGSDQSSVVGRGTPGTGIGPDRHHELSAMVLAAVPASIDRWNEQIRAGVPDTGAFSAEVVRTLELYLFGEPADFEAYWADHGIQPAYPPAAPWPQGKWDERLNIVRTAVFSADLLEVRPVRINGVWSTYWSRSGSAVSRAPSRQGSLDGTNIYEVVLPGVFLSDNKGPFSGRLGFEFTWNASRNNWVLTQITAYDSPESSSVTLPPM